MYKAILRFSELSDSVFYYAIGFKTVWYDESVRSLYKDMSSLARLIKRNKYKYNLPKDIKITFRLYTENWETIGDRFYF